MAVKITLPVLFALILAGCNTTSGGPGILRGQRHEVVESDLIAGHLLTLGPFASVDSKCRVTGQARASIVRRPAFGTAGVSLSSGDIAFSPGNILASCNDQPIRATTVTYRARSNYSGDDRFSFRLVFPDGEIRDITVNTHVQRP